MLMKMSIMRKQSLLAFLVLCIGIIVLSFHGVESRSLRKDEIFGMQYSEIPTKMKRMSLMELVAEKNKPGAGAAGGGQQTKTTTTTTNKCLKDWSKCPKSKKCCADAEGCLSLCPHLDGKCCEGTNFCCKIDRECKTEGGKTRCVKKLPGKPAKIETPKREERVEPKKDGERIAPEPPKKKEPEPKPREPEPRQPDPEQPKPPQEQPEPEPEEPLPWKTKEPEPDERIELEKEVAKIEKETEKQKKEAEKLNSPPVKDARKEDEEILKQLGVEDDEEPPASQYPNIYIGPYKPTGLKDEKIPEGYEPVAQIRYGREILNINAHTKVNVAADKRNTPVTVTTAPSAQ